MKTTVINIRAAEQIRNLIDLGAAMENKSRTEFMLDSALTNAEIILLDKCIFNLTAEKYNEVLKLLDAPLPPNNALKALLQE